MKILFLTVDRSNVVTKHWGWVHDELSRQADVDFIKLPLQGLKAGQFARKVSLGEIKIGSVVWPQLQKKKYDFIMTDSNFAFQDEPWDKIDIPRGMIIQDLHHNKKNPTENPYFQVQIAKKQKWDIVFHRFKYPIHYWFPELSEISKLVWMPHCIDPTMFNDWKLPKKHEVLMTGWHFDEYYPNRHRAHEILKNCSYYYEVERPAESGKPVSGRWPEASDYSKLLNQSKICITGGLKHNYVILKYFEMSASNTCIFSNWFDELSDVGFIPNENIVVMDFNNLKEQVEWWLEHDIERKRVANNAYDLVMSRHTAKIRINQILKEIEWTLQ
jgi:hypothetical protein